MAKIDRLKKRLIRQAVRDNLDLLGRRRSSRSGHRLRLFVTGLRMLFFVLLPAALFASTILVTTMSDDWNPESAADSPVVRQAASRGSNVAAAVPRDPGPAAGRFVTPAPIDPTILPLAVRRVILDPGHGGDNLGTKAPEGLIEKEVTLDIANRVRSLLEKRSFEVMMTRDGDRSLSLRDRAAFANDRHGDIFVSIHVNWMANRELRGVETFYLGPTDDPYLQELAARENQQSGYSLADFKALLEQVYAGVRQEESRKLAEAVQNSLFGALHDVNTGVRDRGVKSAPFGVLMWTQMPAILAEVSCLSNRVEARLLMTPVYRQYLAEAIVRGVEEYTDHLARNDRIVGSQTAMNEGSDD